MSRFLGFDLDGEGSPSQRHHDFLYPCDLITGDDLDPAGSPCIWTEAKGMRRTLWFTGPSLALYRVLTCPHGLATPRRGAAPLPVIHNRSSALRLKRDASMSTYSVFVEWGLSQKADSVVQVVYLSVSACGVRSLIMGVRREQVPWHTRMLVFFSLSWIFLLSCLSFLRLPYGRVRILVPSGKSSQGLCCDIGNVAIMLGVGQGQGQECV